MSALSVRTAAYNNKGYALFSSQRLFYDHNYYRLKTLLTLLNDVAYRISCERGKVYIRETGRRIQGRIKEDDRDIRLALTQTTTLSEHAHNTGHQLLWNEVKVFFFFT